MLRSLITLALVGACSYSSPTVSSSVTDDRVPIILIEGQSNAVGEAELGTLLNAVALGLTDPFPDVQYAEQLADKPIDPLVWGTVRGPIALQARSNGGFGIELTLGRRLVARGHTVAIGKIAIGSTLLATHWQPIDSDYPANGPSLIAQSFTFGHALEESLHGRVIGVIWIQSEADANNQVAAASYGGNMINLIDAEQHEYPGSWFLFNELHAGGFTYTPVIRSKQSYVAATLPNVREITVDDLTMNPASPAHFTAPSYATLGDRFGDEAADLMEGN